MVTEHQEQDFGWRQTTTVHIVCGICVYNKWIMDKEKEAGAEHKDHRAGAAWSCQGSTEAASQQGCTCRGGRHQFLETILVRYDFSLVFDRLLVMSLWKPGIPYPVHGRVLVEIQRPRSLHRKAVIQLSTKRNQQNQSKHQFTWK